MRLRIHGAPAALVTALLLISSAAAQDGGTPDEIEQRLAELERESAELRALLEAQRAAAAEADAARAEETAALLDELAAVQAGAGAGGDRWFDRFTLGGYGEHHFNFAEGEGGDLSDIHRFVLYLGYRFSDHLRLNSETEIEHAFVADGDGELSIEQLWAELDLGESHHLRMGRVLAPIGIINERHEPPTFNGVERPSVDRVVIPTTWPVDGAGVAGDLSDDIRYQLYAVGGLDGSKFDDLNGLRDGRIFERPSLNDPGLTGRLDWFPPLGSESETPHDLRLGASFFYGGYDNGDQGKDPGVDGDVTLLAGDFEYSLCDLDLRGVFARANISNAGELNEALADEMGVDPGIGDAIQGWYLESAYHLMPDSWRRDALEDGDLVAFVRYEEYDTQHELDDEATANPAADRTDLTLGLGLFLTPQFVIKADYQILDDDAPGDRAEQVNLGFGYRF